VDVKSTQKLENVLHQVMKADEGDTYIWDPLSATEHHGGSITATVRPARHSEKLEHYHRSSGYPAASASRDGT
jgi:hypothetical protein